MTEASGESMASSFLQFCATCEKQIVVPNNSILYCSQSCRHRDSNKTMLCSFISELSPPPSPTPSCNQDDASERDIVPRRSPTSSPSQPLSYSISDVSETAGLPRRGRRCAPHETDAARYLIQFHSVSNITFVRRSRAPKARPVASTAVSSTPSLSHTPVSAASTSIPFTPSNRPLPSRTSPYSSYFGPRSIDLVTPIKPVAITAPASLGINPSPKSATVSRASTSVIEGQILYEKRMTITSATPTQSNLRQLLGLDDLQLSPMTRTEPEPTMVAS